MVEAANVIVTAAALAIVSSCDETAQGIAASKVK
jgi:hypothetical protein